MKKLTLENISAYLPYRLKYKDIPEGYNGIRTLKLNTIEWCLTNGKPILHPISDLTKPITVDGVEQIPIVELAKISDHENNWKQHKSGLALCGSLTFGFDAGSFYRQILGKFTHVDNQYALFQYLAKHKFDFMGLIDAGLAVDVNTLEINPYK